MAEAQGTKRARANTAGDTHAPLDSEKLRKYVQQLDRDTLTSIVVQAATSYADVNASINDAIRKIREKERNRVIDFDHYSGSVWREINVTYSSMKGSKQYDKSFDVAHDVQDTINRIAKQCGPFANPRTRYNGLSVLRKIGKTIALSSTDTLGHEVQKQFSYGSYLEDGMVKIVSAMQPDERRAIRQDLSSSESLWPKLIELEKLGDQYCLYGKLGSVMKLLEGGKLPEGEGEVWEEDYDEDEEYGEYDEEGEGEGEYDEDEESSDEEDYEDFYDKYVEDE
ncbi:hypothetical protein FQN54_004206 [Arachnomyces sp. PD_36]|nr:hypothetical protein FQN54_004206 [Arachnomyces sp. PD_36]